MIIIKYFINLIKYFFIFFLITYLIQHRKIKNEIEKRIIRFNKIFKKHKSNKDTRNYLNSIGEYVNLIQNNKVEMVNFMTDINNPKISFIVPVFNKEKYLKSLILSIQHQLIEEFEIIFIDDCSSDQSIKIINEFSLIDRRIKLIKNKNNRGTLYSRSQGCLHSKGEYINFIDPDDLVLKDGLYNSYNYLKKNRLSIIQYNSVFHSNKSLILSTRYYYYENIIKQPILSHVFFYNCDTKSADELNTALWDKLIEKKTCFKMINFIGSEYYNKLIKIENDVILLFSLFKVADSYQYINEIGYFYFENHNDSISNSWNNPDFFGSIVKGLFINIQFFYEKAGNFSFDKSFAVFKLQQSFNRYTKCFINAKNEFPLMKKVLELLLYSPYIKYRDKITISIIHSAIISIYQNKIIK